MIRRRFLAGMATVFGWGIAEPFRIHRAFEKKEFPKFLRGNYLTRNGNGDYFLFNTRPVYKTAAPITIGYYWMVEEEELIDDFPLGNFGRLVDPKTVHLGVELVNGTMINNKGQIFLG